MKIDFAKKSGLYQFKSGKQTSRKLETPKKEFLQKRTSILFILNRKKKLFQQNQSSTNFRYISTDYIKYSNICLCKI